MLGGCAGGGAHGKSATPAQTGRPITAPQALTLARVLELDRSYGGSSLAGTYSLQGTSIDLAGSIDFVSGDGEFVAHQQGLGPLAARRFFWTRDVVLAQAASGGPGRSRYQPSAPNPRGDPIHALIQFVQLLSSETIDNLQLLESRGIVYLGPRTIDGRRLDVYRYGSGNTTYSIDPASGLLYRVDALLEATGAKVTINLRDHRRVHIALPPRSNWTTR